jgi:hypothetical protein
MQKRSSFFIIASLLLLIGIAVFVYYNKGKTSTVDEDARNFKFKDTALITKIFIADKNGNKSLLKRTAKGWVVNDKYACRTDAVLNLLEVIKHVDVKMSVSKQAKESTLKYMSTTAIKVEIYVGEKLVRQYYVGHEPQGSEGSYMLLTNTKSGENYPDPYLCHIPGFVGFLKPRFIANENEWRDRLVLNYTPPQIKQISVEHFGYPDSSFTIELLNTTTFKLFDGNKREMAFNPNKLKQYLAYYQNISYEYLFTGKNKKLEDSLSLQKPFCKITVIGNDFSNNEYTFYHKQPPAKVPEMGVSYSYDPDRFYLRFSNNKEWALVQYFVFGKLLITPLYFRN